MIELRNMNMYIAHLVEPDGEGGKAHLAQHYLSEDIETVLEELLKKDSVYEIRAVRKLKAYEHLAILGRDNAL